MGFSPQQVEVMTYWQFLCCYEGVSKERGWKVSNINDIEPMSIERARELGVAGL